MPFFKDKREELKLTQREMAEKINMPLSTYRKYEQGIFDVGQLPLKKVNEIATILNIKIEEIEID